MGNCIQSGSDGDGDQGPVQTQARKRSGNSQGVDQEEEAGSAASVLKVKMVLTKGELEWLMAQLKAGDRRLEDVLRDMARKRDHARASGWRPSLESILECSAESAHAGAGAD